MDKKVVVINGSGGVGKDTFVSLCGKYVKVINVSSIDPYKELLFKTGWDSIKNDKSRKTLSDLKNISIMFNDGPTNYVENKYHEFLLSDNDIMFVHIREPEEIKKVVDRINALTLLITSKRIEKMTSNKADASVLEYDYDDIISNDGTIEELEIKAKSYVKKLVR